MAQDIEEVSDIEYYTLLVKKQHEIFMSAINTLVGVLKNDNSGVSRAIDKNSTAVDAFIKKIAELSQPQQPEVNVNTNQQEVVSAITEMKKAIIDNLSKDIKPKEWEFKIVRNNYGTIESVTAKPK